MYFYRVQPSEFWRLDADELAALSDWMQAYQQAVKEANRA